MWAHHLRSCGKKRGVEDAKEDKPHVYVRPPLSSCKPRLEAEVAAAM